MTATGSCSSKEKGNATDWKTTSGAHGIDFMHMPHMQAGLAFLYTHLHTDSLQSTALLQQTFNGTTSLSHPSPECKFIYNVFYKHTWQSFSVSCCYTITGIGFLNTTVELSLEAYDHLYSSLLVWKKWEGSGADQCIYHYGMLHPFLWL